MPKSTNVGGRYLIFFSAGVGLCEGWLSLGGIANLTNPFLWNNHY